MKSKVYITPETQEENDILRNEFGLPRFELDVKTPYGMKMFIYGRYECSVEQFALIQERFKKQ